VVSKQITQGRLNVIFVFINDCIHIYAHKEKNKR
jgi:hypothetical protein